MKKTGPAPAAPLPVPAPPSAGSPSAARQTLAHGTVVYTSARHRFGTDAMLLSDFAGVHRRWTVCDLGSGCGILPLRWHDAGHRGPCFGVELDAGGTALLARAARESGADGHITALTADLRGALPLTAGAFDAVCCNPPYFTGGYLSQKPGRAAARHEVCCTVADVCAAAARLLRDGGRLCLCCPPARLCDCMAAARQAGLEPKRLRFVRQRPGAVPWLFLLDARRGGHPGLALLPDLIIENECGGFSDELLRIYGKKTAEEGDRDE